MNQRLENVKAHLKANKNIYIAAGIGVLVGVIVGAGGTMYLKRNAKGITQVINNVAPVFNDSVAPVFNETIAPVFNNNDNVNFGGYLHKIVKCLETGEIFETVKDTANAAGVDVVRMSKHLNGSVDQINDLHYEIIGLGTT